MKDTAQTALTLAKRTQARKASTLFSIPCTAITSHQCMTLP